MNNNKIIKIAFSLMFVSCVGLTDAQYNDGVRQIVFDSIQEDTQDFIDVLLKKAVRVRQNGTAGQRTGAECFMLDLYQSQTGQRDRHGAIHWVQQRINQAGVISE